MVKHYKEDAVMRSAPCSYTSLSSYNAPGSGLQVPIPRGTAAGSYIVPSFSGPSYNTLLYEGPGCAGYPTINNAYRTVGGACDQQYVVKTCE